MMKLCLVATCLLVMASPTLAFEAQSYECVVDDFLDDSRYPAEEASIQLNKAMTISIIDAGDRVVVETWLPGSEVESRQLPVAERDGYSIVAQVQGEQSLYSVTLDAPQGGETPAPVTGSLINRTYEVDQTWRFRCGGSDGAAEAARQSCLATLSDWANSDVSDKRDEPRRDRQFAELEACLADGRLTQDDLEQQYYLGKPPG